ncbi:zinc metalloprotease HtpX [Candidatus Bathyarchaeota archaeon]|nr:zinc metalloprotease HtpX [Candidatus Bathyarchaeota archaeon]
MSTGLRVSMVTTLVIIIGLSTLFFSAALSLLGVFDILSLVIFVSIFNVLQWLIAPYMVDAIYGVKEVSAMEKPELYNIVERVSQRSMIHMPRVMLANIPIPNAFAYGSPLTGTRIAVTTGLLKVLEPEEVESVIGHELGHVRHNDVQVMMFVSVLPAILYSIGYSLSWSARFSRDREKSSGAAMLGTLSMLLYFVLTLLSLRFSRLREYYADRHSVAVVDDGARKLSEALAKIVTYTGRMSRFNDVKAYSNFKALFISDPDTAEKDALEIQEIRGSDQQLVNRVLSSKVSTFDSFTEILSTHPNIVKRLRALQSLQ